MNLKANYDKIIIKVLDEGETRLGNIIIPDMGKEKPEMGVITAVGPGFYSLTGILVPNQLKVGQVVLVPKFGVQTISFGNEDYMICKESDVLAIVISEQPPLKMSKSMISNILDETKKDSLDSLDSLLDPEPFVK